MGCLMKASITAVVVGAIAIILGAVLGFAVLPDFVDSEIAANVELVVPDQYSRFEKLPFPLTFKITFFEIQNPDEVLAGTEHPNVTEKGPYVYKQHMQKTDIVRDETGQTIDFTLKITYEFDQEASGSLKETDKIWILDVPKYGAFMEALKTGATFVANMLANAAFPDSANHLFHEIEVKQYLFDGYTFCKTNNALCVVLRLKALEIPAMTVNDDDSVTFAFFKHKEEPVGPITVDTGANDAKQVGQILSFKGSPNLDIWNGEKCNKVVGTDTTIYAPYGNTDTVFDVFSIDICRSVKLEYSSEMEYKEVLGYHSRINKNTLASGETYPDNQCFCLDDTKLRTLNGEPCFPDGFLDMIGCQKSAVVASFPHLLWADPAYASTVNGLNPQEDLHAIFVDLEPNTGTPLRGGKRLQFNMILKQIKNIDLTENLLPSVMPLVWVEEGTELPDNLIEKLNDDYFSKLPIVDGVTWGLIGAGIALVVVGGIVIVVQKKKKSKRGIA